ncbi:MAG: ATPase F0F1 [Zetaproteobacteria bacterium CG12_big_fil_rev_8_21_14_0_65_54_13]|nr:MAG: ATPase F0F1 [Zetaproteobacteria bacterium CG12_big_fil_rev_8_21_14_0_65_54_13]PIX54776.1 MAG: ATPase F0F1 [Zetaproteobacteria bacterium CG_4_10_14_3_um_filter_54_28]PJA29668.1 MAG: ATPase F0F1 [Zetaproteobacteria bacterium CG_4_9_14_3_um_filter_54_145]
MNEFISLLFSLLAGALLGLFFFAGLWWTVRKIESSKQVALLMISSMFLRTGVVVLGFYFILGDNWQHLLVGLLGFIIARIIITRLTRRSDQSDNSMTAGSL